MRWIATIPDLQSFAREARVEGKSLGLVPTMGALHDGHLSLVRRACAQCDVVIVSIFVNPAQFGPAEDLARYPRNLERDRELLEKFRVDVVFAPEASEMYPPGFDTWVHPGALAEVFEGAIRPGHFRGVATVVLKLFHLVQPDVAYFGQKDFQQVQVVRRMVEDLNLPVRLVVCPIVREPDGLAMSSRNAYLNPEERGAATVLHRSLRRAESLVHGGETNAARLVEEIRRTIEQAPGVRLDYAAVVEPGSLQSVERVAAGCVALVAARVGPARLIDNLILGPPGETEDRLIQLALASKHVAPSDARIPGLEIDLLRKKVENCRECAAVSAIRLPPAEFALKYLRRDYPDLGTVRTAIIARDSPLKPENYLYWQPARENRFTTSLFQLVGVANLEEFRSRFILTDALRCHCTGPRAPERALMACARFLREELRLFPNLRTILILGEDAYVQFQRSLLGRSAAETVPFASRVKSNGWAEERLEMEGWDGRLLRVLYAHHPSLGYERSPSLAPMLNETR
jgi:pantoate--beta-alanine ligase